MVQACHYTVLNGFIWHYLSTVLSSAVDKSQQRLEKNSWEEHRESNLGLLGKKQVCYLCAMQPPLTRFDFSNLSRYETFQDLIILWLQPFRSFRCKIKNDGNVFSFKRNKKKKEKKSDNIGFCWKRGYLGADRLSWVILPNEVLDPNWDDKI